jgi:uncharacterized membrane protein YoaK (UPF0700 family)
MPWERRYAFLFGLTGAAGALDALAFLHLGKVFNSFQSGNVLFVGLGIGNANGGLVVRAGAVLVAFFLGAALGSRLIGTRLSPRRVSVELQIAGIEAALLALFAALWLVIGTPDDHPVVRVMLLAIGALAMGIQASLSLSLKVPNVMTVALTATIAALGQRTGIAGPTPRDDLPSTPLLAALTATYLAVAVAIATLPDGSALSLIPLGVLAAGVGPPAARRRRGAARQGAAAGPRPARGRHTMTAARHRAPAACSSRSRAAR